MPKIYSVGEKSLRFKAVCIQKGSGRGGYSPEGLPWGLSGKESAYQEGDAGSIPGSERFLGDRNGNPLQYSCLGNPMDRRACQATVYGGYKRLGHVLATK